MSQPRPGRIGYRTVLSAALCVAAAMVLTSCSGAPPPPPAKPAVTLGPAPTGYSEAASELPAVLDANNAYLAGATDVRIVNTESGQIVATVRPQHQALPASVQGQPLLSTVGNGKAVLWPFLVAAPSGGTAVELASIRTDSHQASSVLVGLPGWAANSTTLPSVTVVGAQGSAVVLQVALGLSRGTVATDTGTGRPLWSRDGFTAGAVTGGTVVGSEADAMPEDTDHLSGLALDTGQPRWTLLHGHDFTVSPAGDTLVAVDSVSATGQAKHSVALVAAATGATVNQLSFAPDKPARCMYDQASVTICSVPADPQGDRRETIAVDSRTGRQLWTTPNWDVPQNATGGGRAPLVSAAWHGKVYASTGVSTAVYDARTGTPMQFLPGPSPMVADDHTGLALSPDKANIVARPLTGEYNYVPTEQGCAACR
ncbi:MAG TPA: hypothetical protein VGM60_11370 [Pseudonocardia sp.]|uniref:hypothetical protein n=1 Tax=Pseudonocardia sp. TaxID=60912 RepID=UPI002F3EB612